MYLKLLESEVSIKRVLAFEDQYKRSEGAGHALSKDQLMALITDDAIYDIESAMIVHRPKEAQTSWKSTTGSFHRGQRYSFTSRWFTLLET